MIFQEQEGQHVQTLIDCPAVPTLLAGLQLGSAPHLRHAREHPGAMEHPSSGNLQEKGWVRPCLWQQGEGWAPRGGPG